MKTYVVYKTTHSTSGVIMDHEEPYNTEKRLLELRDFISEMLANGDPCVVINLIPLQEDE